MTPRIFGRDIRASAALHGILNDRCDRVRSILQKEVIKVRIRLWREGDFDLAPFGLEVACGGFRRAKASAGRIVVGENEYFLRLRRKLNLF